MPFRYFVLVGCWKKAEYSLWPSIYLVGHSSHPDENSTLKRPTSTTGNSVFIDLVSIIKRTCCVATHPSETSLQLLQEEAGESRPGFSIQKLLKMLDPRVWRCGCSCNTNPGQKRQGPALLGGNCLTHQALNAGICVNAKRSMTGA